MISTAMAIGYNLTINLAIAQAICAVVWLNRFRHVVYWMITVYLFYIGVAIGRYGGFAQLLLPSLYS